MSKPAATPIGVKKIARINSARFTWEKFSAKCGVSQLEIVTHDFTMLMAGVVPVGWCYGHELVVRPRTEGAAILVRVANDFEDEDSGEIEVWLHVPDQFAEDYCEGFKKTEARV